MRFLTALLLTLISVTTLTAHELYVSPAGDDAQQGTQDRPFRSVSHALSVLRSHERGTIWLDRGEYFLASGIAMSDADSGSPEQEVEIRAIHPHQARISGARPVTDFHPISEAVARRLISTEARQHVLEADLRKQGLRKQGLRKQGLPSLSPLPERFLAPGCEELIFDDRPMQMARWPNKGFETFTEVIDPGASKPVHWVTREVYRPGSFRFPSDRAKHWDFSRGVYLHGFWCYEWADEVLRAASYDTDTGELRFAAKHRYGIGNPWDETSERQFYALNVLEELDQPGEYYLDRAQQMLYFWPPNDIASKETRISFCRQPLLTANGVQHMVLRDLVFENGCHEAITLRNCSHFRVQNCLIRNMGRQGISIAGGNDNHVIGCEVTRTGSRAISVTAGDRPTLTPGNCSVIGNHLHHVGRYDWGGGRGVSLGGCGNRIANNLIHHCPTGAVSYGGNEHILELNEIHDVCLLYGDVGVFYTGRDWSSRGNIVRWNFIHDVAENHGFGSQAFYLDDCDSGDTISGNIVYGGVGKGVVVGGGRDNIISGNIFIQLAKGIHVDARGPKGITLDKPGSWNLKDKCEAVQYHSPLWKRKYPKLATVLDDEPLMPLGNKMHNNVFISCQQPWSLKKEVKPEWLDRADNYELSADDFPFLPAPGADTAPDLAIIPRIWSGLIDFTPIPVDRIGLAGYTN